MNGNWIKRVIGGVLCGLTLGFALLPVAAQSDQSLLAQDGSYQVGVQIMHLTDASRDNRALETYVWYPALVSKDAKPPYAPDTRGAPYPLIIYSHRFQASVLDEGWHTLINHLVSMGFIVAASDHMDTDNLHAIIDRPLDVLFVLNQLADLKDNPLVGMIDTDNVGVAGLSIGADTSLAVGGARVDPGHLANWCSTYSDAANSEPCTLISDWGKVLAYHDQLESPSKDNLWSATTDDRIRAIMPMEPCYAQLFGEEGLAAVTIPTLLIAAAADTACPNDVDAAYIYANLGSQDRYFLSVDKYTHYDLMDATDLIQQYASAFFGFYLQGKTDYAQYLTPDSASAFKDVTLEAQVGGK